MDTQEKAIFEIWRGPVYLGWTDSKEHAEGVIRQNLAIRRRGQHNPCYRREYSIVEKPSTTVP